MRYFRFYDEANIFFDDELNGLSISAAYMFSNRIVIQGNYYWSVQNNFGYRIADGWDFLAFLGNGLATTGGKWYLGGGFFNEQLDQPQSSNTFNVMQIGAVLA